MKKNKVFKLFFILIIFTFSLEANPFFSGNPKAPMHSNQQQSEQQEKNNQEQKKYKEPRPVLTGPTNQKLATAQWTLREKIATFFKSWETSTGKQRNKILLGLILTSMLYGLLHAAGPGHRKTVVFSLYLARKSPWYEPLITGLILALLHGGCAIVLMLLFKGVRGSISANTNAFTIYMEGFTYGLLIVLALIMIIKETIEFIKNRKNNFTTNQKTEDEKKIKLLPFLISGIYPCPGAILILILSYTLDILWAGIIAVIFMSLGMAILIIFVAYLAWFGRQGLFMTIKNHKETVAKVTFAVEIVSYTFLLLFSLYVSMPFFVSIL